MACYAITQSTTTWPLVFFLAQSSDHITGLTGASPTVTLSKNGGAFVGPSGAVSEMANGWYKVAGNATDSNTLGPLVLHATAASGDPTDVVYEVVAYAPQDGASLGLSRLDAAISSRLAPLGDVYATVTGYATAEDPGYLVGVTLVNDFGLSGTRVSKLDNLDAAVTSRQPSGNVTVSTNLDKTGYGLTSGEHTSIQADVQAGLTGQGVTAARAGKLDNLDVAVSSRAASSSGGLPGPGATAYVVTVHRPDHSTPLAGVSCWVSTDAAGGNVIAGTLVTNASGQVTFLLDSGSTYYLWQELAGWSFPNPTSFTV